MAGETLILASLPALFRRRIAISAEAQCARSEMEDDFHRFDVSVLHSDGAVTDVSAHAERHPWDTCPSAASALKRLEGAPLTQSFVALQERAQIRSQCTHMFDLAALAIAAAARGPGQRVYDVDVDVLEDMRFRARLARDGAPVLAWDVAATRITSPGLFENVSVKSGFPEWAEASLDLDMAEAAFVLRRCILVANGRRIVSDAMPRATDVAQIMGGACFSFQPEVTARAVRVKGFTRDFAQSRPLAHAPLARGR